MHPSGNPNDTGKNFFFPLCVAAAPAPPLPRVTMKQSSFAIPSTYGAVDGAATDCGNQSVFPRRGGVAPPALIEATANSNRRAARGRPYGSNSSRAVSLLPSRQGFALSIPPPSLEGGWAGLRSKAPITVCTKGSAGIPRRRNCGKNPEIGIIPQSFCPPPRSGGVHAAMRRQKTKIPQSQSPPHGIVSL